jgi:uncharacterized protein (DUF58 family)
MLYVGMTLLLGFGAVNTGNNLLYLLVSALLGFMATSGVLGRANLSRLQVDCELPDEIFAGRPAHISLHLRNGRRRLHAFLLETGFSGGDTLLPLVPAGGEAHGSVTLTFDHRGEQGLPLLELRSRYPINFFIRTIRLPVTRKVLVFPAPRPGPLPAAPETRRPQSSEHYQGRGYEGELRTINDYRGGEPLKAIHWKLSARHSELKVKELSGPVGEPVMIDPAALSGSLEERLSQASYLIVSLIRQGRPVGLQLGRTNIAAQTGRRHKLRLLTELARHAQA